MGALVAVAMALSTLLVVALVLYLRRRLVRDPFLPGRHRRVAGAVLAGSLVVMFGTIFGVRLAGDPPLARVAEVGYVMLAVFFYLIASGTTLFGLLMTRAAQRLGNISYSVYLLQGLALALVYWSEPLRTLSLSSVAAFWMLEVGCSIVLTSAAALTYLYIELPGIRLERKYSASRSSTHAEGMVNSAPVARTRNA